MNRRASDDLAENKEHSGSGTFLMKVLLEELTALKKNINKEFA